MYLRGFLGDAAHKQQLKDIRAGAGSGSSSSGSGGTSDSTSDGKIFGMPPVVVVAGGAAIVWVVLSQLQKRRGAKG